MEVVFREIWKIKKINILVSFNGKVTHTVGFITKWCQRYFFLIKYKGKEERKEIIL